MNVAAPAGWTYAVPSIENVAWAELDADASARIATNAWFTGYSWTVTDARKVDGPLYNYWETTSTPETPQWAPCGESFNLNVAVTTRVDGPPSNTVSLLATNIGRPTWRQC